jgi:hypothetical protein
MVGFGVINAFDCLLETLSNAFFQQLKLPPD